MYTVSNYSLRRYSNFQSNQKSVNDISFGSLFNRDKFITKLHLNPMWHFREFSPEEYSKLTDRELRILRKRYQKLQAKDNEKYTAIETSNCKLASGMYEHFNRLYGKGKYTVIVIGRSLSLAGKALSYLIGADNVKNIPLSFAQQYTSSHAITLANNKGLLKGFVEFLDGIGLGKKDIAKSNKHKFILIDYCYSGYSLRGANCLLQSDYVYGRRKNIKTSDVINDCIDDVCLKSKILRALFDGEFKKYSFVKNCRDLSKIKKSKRLSSDVGRNVKLVWFNLLDKMVRMKIR